MQKAFDRMNIKLHDVISIDTMKDYPSEHL
jgi:hypothetical protein